MRRVVVRIAAVLVIVMIAGYMSNAVSKRAVEAHVRAENMRAGERVKQQWQLKAPPSSFARAEQVAPFVFRVRYAWMVRGERMSFGEGGEKLVLAVFGKTTELKTHAQWNL